MKPRGRIERASRREKEREERKAEWQKNRIRERDPAQEIPPTVRLCLPEELRPALGDMNPDWVRRQLKELAHWDREANEKKLTGEDVCSVLELAFCLTGDHAFADALDTMRQHGLAIGSLKLRFRNLLRKPAMEAYVPLVSAEMQKGRRLQEALK
jgi:hypothetical protein